MKLNRRIVLDNLTDWKSTQSVLVLTASANKVVEVDVMIGNAEIAGYNFLFADFPQLDDDYIILGCSQTSIDVDTLEHQDSKGTSFHFFDFYEDNLTAVEYALRFRNFDFSLIDRRAFRDRDARVFVQINDYNTVIAIPAYIAG